MVNYDYTDKKHLDAENTAWVSFRRSVLLSANDQLQNGSEIAKLISDFNSNSKLNTPLEKTAYDPKHMIDIVISTVVVASRVCGRDLAKCKGMNASTRKTIVDQMKIAEINVTEHFKNITFYPYTTEIISFDPDGYQKYNDLRVEVYNGTTGDISTPWVYTAEGKFEKLLRAEGGYLPSNCLETCEQCFNIDDIRYSYLPGDIIILGLFSIRAHGETAFTCGERDQANDIITVSAFMHSVQEKRNGSGIPFGALAIDDCYNGMNTTNFLFDLFNKRVFITDPATNAIIDMDKVVAIIGPVSSPVALVVGDFAKSISLPIVSYGASSPDLDNKLRYQYLLRTVPSDPLQVRGMVDMLEYLNTTHVGLLYYDDAYGINGKEGLLNEAKTKHICIREPMKLTPYMEENELAKIITNIFQMELRVVLFFGTDTLAKRLLVELKKHTNPKPLIFIASEGWGTNIELVDKDLSKKSLGSIVFTVSSKAYMNTTYKQLLEQLNITQTQYNRWIPNYFEKINRCVLRNSFEKSSSPICNEINMSKNLSGELVNSLISDQRAVHARLAVHAVTEGFKRFCGSIACAPTVRTNTARFIDEIKAVTVNSDRLFDEHGNGNIGFTIYNIQLTDGGHAFYKEVGQYGTDRKLKITNPLRFYDTLGNNVSLNSSAEFRSYINCLNYVVNNGACSQTCGEKTTQLPPVTIPVTIMTTSANENGEDNAFRIALIALSVAFGVFVLVFLVVTILLFRWVKHKPNSLSSGTTGSASGKSDLDTMYHISGSGYMTTFDNAGFDVNSLHSHPRTPISTRDTRIIPNGRANSVSSFGSGPVQYSDVRMLQPFGAVGHHIRQRSNIEMHKVHLDSFERPSSVLSVPVGNSYGLKTSPGMRKYKRQDLANLGKHSSNSHLIGPSSAPANHQQSRPRAVSSPSRPRAVSSPRFRYPSDDEHYVLPSDMQRSAHTRRLAVSEDDLFCASSNSPDNAEPVQYHSSCFTPCFGDENAAVDKNESQLNYATLMAKDSEDGDDVDANEFNAHMSHSSGSLSEIVFEDMDCVNGNLAELNNGFHGGRKQSSRKGSLVISPSDKEVMKINYPDDDITSVLVQDHAKPKTDNHFLKINNRTPSGNSTLPGPRSTKETMEYLGSLQNVPDIIKLDHYPCDDSDGDGLVFTI
ncbi:uncharacterized protein LOC127864286 [Dreissena polymorpha]|nr:uncharacterized protein LOC127864286 [Dreissena polymorpha]